MATSTPGCDVEALRCGTFSLITAVKAIQAAPFFVGCADAPHSRCGPAWTASISPAVSFAALTMARDFSSWSFPALQEWLFDLQISLPGNQHLIRLLQAEIARREDAAVEPEPEHSCALAGLVLPY